MLAKILGAAGRAVAEVVGAVVVPPRTLVIGRAVENLEMDVGMVESDPAELHQIFRLQPDREPAVIQRLVAEIADPQASDADAVLVGIERADRLAECLADAVAAVGAHRHVGADAVMPRIEADRMVGRGEHDALDALFARGLEQIIAADDIGLQDIVPRTFDGKSAEMQDAVDALADGFDLGEVGEVGGLEFLARAEVGGRFHVAEHQIRIDREQQLAQACADFTGSAGHQYAWHFIPLGIDLRSSTAGDSKPKLEETQQRETPMSETTERPGWRP